MPDQAVIDEDAMFATDEQLARALDQIEAFLLDLQARAATYARITRTVKRWLVRDELRSDQVSTPDPSELTQAP